MAKTPRSVRTARDNARARALGYRSYYDYRLHDNGRRPPDAPVPPAGTAERARLRGHRGTADLLRTLRPGDVLVVPDGLAAIAKDSKGRYARVDVMVLREDGRADTFTIRRATYDRMTRIVDRINASGAIFSPSPSLDIRRLLRVADRPEHEYAGDELRGPSIGDVE